MKRSRNFKRVLFRTLFILEAFFKDSNVIASTCIFAILCTAPTIINGGEYPLMQVFCIVVDVFLACIAIDNMEFDDEDDTSEQ